MSHPFALYNPALLPPEVLLSEYSARLPLLETLLGIVRSNQPGHPPQHCLLIGARGMGKTTTLWAVAHKISRDYELARQWQPVVFDEESRRVGDLADFWLEAIRQWEFATKATTDLTGPLLAQNPPDIEERAHRLFTDLVARSGKRVVLLIDNLNDLLASIRDAEPLHRLRAALMQDSGIMLIGGATSHFEHVTSVDQPFYDFFRIFELKPLTLDEMRECLQTLAKSRGDADVEKALVERSGSIHALHILTGGNPRLIKTFYRLLREGLHTDIRADLEKLLDEFTPYFKSIVDALSGQQQRILDAVALAWNPVEVATLATATRLPPNHVSAQLRALMKLGILREAAGHPKKKTYLLTDRFSNIHYLMRHGRAARNRLDWFVATIRVLFPDKAHELIAKLAHDSAECGPQGLHDARDVLRSALSRSETVSERQKLVHHTLEETWSAPAMAKLSEWFDVERAKADMPEVDVLAFCQHMPAELRKALGFKPKESRWWYQLNFFLRDKQAWQLTEAAFRKAIELDPEDAWPWNGLGNVLQDHLQRPSEAEAAYRRAIELDPKDSLSWNSLGDLFQDYLHRPLEAEAAYRKATELDPKDAAPWLGLAQLLSKLSPDTQEARKYAVTALPLRPDYGFARHIFTQLCSDHAADWQAVLPTLIAWSLEHVSDTKVFDFIIDGLIRHAQLTKPAETLVFLAELLQPHPFESIQDGLIACDDREHLHRLAPERQAVALELMKRIQETPQAAETPKKKPKRTKSV